MNINKLLSRDISAYAIKYESLPVNLFEDNWKDIDLPLPPENNSTEVKKEFNIIKKHLDTNTKKEKEEIKYQDKKSTPFEFEFLKLIKSIDPKLKKFIDLLTDELFTICLYFKKKYNRTRPFELAEKLKINIPKIKTQTGHSPSYPSGHALSATFLAIYLGDMFPEHRKKLNEFAKEIGENRIKGGIHFPSDVKAGELLAKKLYKLLKVNVRKENKSFKEWFVINDR